MKSMKHLYVGEYATHVHVYCGWHQLVHIRHTTWDWKEVTCVHCLGKRWGLTQQALEQVQKEKSSS